MNKPNLAEMLATLANNVVDADELPDPIAAKRLIEAWRRYESSFAACPFRPGDLVTPRVDSIYRTAGQPHIVVETRSDCPPIFAASDKGLTTFGTRPQMRVLKMNGGQVTPYWVEAFEYERWTGTIAA